MSTLPHTLDSDLTMYAAASHSAASLESGNSLNSTQIYEALSSVATNPSTYSESRSQVVTIIALQNAAPIWYHIVCIAQDILVANIFVTIAVGWAQKATIALMAYEALLEAYNNHISGAAMGQVPHPEQGANAYHLC